MVTYCAPNLGRLFEPTVLTVRCVRFQVITHKLGEQ